MINPFSILIHATRQAWQNYYHTLLISALWLAAQLLVITGPPATAVLFAMARHTEDGAFWNSGNLAHAFRELFISAWIWALPNAIILAALVVFPLSTWWAHTGILWFGLRALWFAAIIAWLGLNMYYWPSWLAAVEPSLRSGYAGSAQFWRRSPVHAFYVFLVSLLVAIICLPLMLPFVLGVIFWIALAAEIAVRHGHKAFEKAG